MSTPFVGFSNATLAGLPSLKAGDKIHCDRGNLFMTGIGGKNTMGVKADVSGEV